MNGKGSKTTKSPVEFTRESIEEMFERKLKKQQASIIEILTANNKIQSGRIRRFQQKVDDLRSSLELTEGELT